MNQTGNRIKISDMLTNRVGVGVILCFVLYAVHLGYISVYFVGSVFFWMSASEIVNRLEDLDRRIPVSAIFLVLSNLVCLVWFVVQLLVPRLNNSELEIDLLNICVINAFSDAAQYFGGKMFGRAPAFPHISPRKTWEGYLFGTAASIIFSHLINFNVPQVEIYVWLIYGHLGGLLSSLVKRELNIKDWSRLLGNHGGFADRTDSMVLSICLHLIRFGTEH